MEGPKYIPGQSVKFTDSRESDDVTLRYKKGENGLVVSSKPYASSHSYVIQTGMTEIVDVPESDIYSPSVNLSTRVDELLSQKEAKRKFKDTEGRIGGSHKEKVAYKQIVISDLNALEIDPITAREMVKKDKVYPKVDAINQQEKGISSGTCYLKVKLREACGNTPPDSAQWRKIYVGFIDLMIKSIDEVPTRKMFWDAIDTLFNNAVFISAGLLAPELLDQLKESRDYIIRKNTDLKKELGLATGLMTDLLEKANVELEKQKPGHHGTFRDLPEDHHLYISLDKIIKDIDRMRQEIRTYSMNELTPVEKTVFEAIGYKSSSLSTLIRHILLETFGKRFYNFIHKNTYKNPWFEKVLADAEYYDGITAEQSQQEISEKTSSINSALENLKMKESFLTSDYTFDQLPIYFQSHNRGIGYYRSQFGFMTGKNHYYWEDVEDNKELAVKYAELELKDIQKNIRNKEAQLNEFIKNTQPREADWSWTGVKVDRKGQTRTDLIANSGIPLSYIKRTGGLEIITDQIDTDEKVKEFFKDKLGITRIEYGLSIPDTEKQEHIRHFAGALLDMFDVLDIDIKKIIHLGNLGIKFASSGKGKASAHYEASRVAINLTRSNGDGTVAHEFAHYLDNMIGKAHGKYLSDYSEERLKYKYDEQNPIVVAMNNIMRYIIKGRSMSLSGQPIERPKIKITIEANEKNIKNYRLPYGIKGETIESFWETFTDYYQQFKYSTRLKPKDMVFLGAIVNTYGLKSFEFEFDYNSSVYYAFSSQMKSDYWSRGHELFARAFETFMFDTLAEKGRVNNYLVSGGYFDNFSRVYPQAEERKDLQVLYMELMNKIKEQYETGPFIPFTDKRVDEYIDLGETKEKTGVIVDSETEELVEVVGEEHENDTAAEKFEQLATLL